MKQLLIILSFFYSVLSFGQSETHDFITYDTTVNVVGGTWNLLITRPRNMFVGGHPDAASRPAIIFMVGSGEIINPAYMLNYGPHYFLNFTYSAGVTPAGGVHTGPNGGWNGDIQLANGTHYPIIISVQPYHTGPTTRSAGNLLLHILNTYHIKSNGVHLTGLSMGAIRWEGLLSVERTVGGEEYMQKITSIAALSGQYDLNGQPDFYRGDLPERDLLITGGNYAPDWGGWKGAKIWVTKYGGRYFALEGASDGTQAYLYFGTRAMNDSLDLTIPGRKAAYFHYYNGGHDYWNTMYDPTQHQWGSSATNNFLLELDGQPSRGDATPGSYKAGSSIFEWMIRQGDTSIVGSSNQSPVANAGSNQTITLPTNQVSLSGSGTDYDGTISTYAWTQVSGTAATITSASSASTTITGLTAGTRVFRLTVTDNLGATGTNDVTITVNPAPSGGSFPAYPGIQRVGPSEYATFWIDSDSVLWSSGGNPVLWGTGNVGRQALLNRVKSDASTFLPKCVKLFVGLDDAVAIDKNGRVWHIGGTDLCAAGDGTTFPGAYSYATMIDTDSLGNTFGDVKMCAQYWQSYTAKGWYALKNDSTLWVWGGDDIGGFRGTGTAQQFITRPVQYTAIPNGRKVTQIVAGTFALALAADGTAWTWGAGACDFADGILGYNCTGTDWKLPHQVPSVANGKWVFGGRGIGGVICGGDSVWAWGGAARLATGTINNSPFLTPQYMNPYWNPTFTADGRTTNNAGVVNVVANTNAAHLILRDSTLWAIGSTPQGETGNGASLDRDLQTPYPTGYSWDYTTQLFLTTPVRLVPSRHDFINSYGGTPYTYWFFDEAVNGQLYFNGRNKGALAGDGEINQDTTSGQQASEYDNMIIKPLSVPVNPYTLRSVIMVPATPCIVGAGIGTLYNGCGTYVAQPYHAGTLDAGPYQASSGITTTLTATGTAFTGRKYASFVWLQETGPTNVLFNTHNDSTVSVSRMATGGTYRFKIYATDNFNSVTTDTVSVKVTGTIATNIPPTANAGANQTINIATQTQVTLSGSGTDPDGTIASYFWQQISGTSATIGNQNTGATNVTGLTTAGIRVFRLTVTDNQGATGTSDVTITVNGQNPGTGTETSDYITEDGTIDFPGVGAWNWRISRPRNMFTVGHPDTASRPVIIFMVGVGEACNCPGYLGLNGPHALLKDFNNSQSGGWDGGIQMGNGMHYPIYISVQPHAQWPSSKSSRMLIEHLLNTYHIKRNSVNLTGLSMGAMTWTRMINSGTGADREASMKLVRSIAALQGQGNGYYAWRRDANNSAPLYQLGGDSITTPELYSDMYTEPLGSAPNTHSLAWKAYRIWAAKYGGRYMSLTGIADFAGPDGWLISEAMNDSVANSGYFAWENIYGGGAFGGHGGWNTMYDPARTDWTSVGTLGPNIVPSGYYGPSLHLNTMGNYKKGYGVFGWMLQQSGDTSIVGGGPGHSNPTVNAGPNQTVALGATATLNGSATANNGGSITSYVWTQPSGTAATISSPSTASTTITGLTTAGVRVFTLTAFDNEGYSTSSDVTITVSPAQTTKPTVTTSDVSTSTNGANVTSSSTGSAGIASVKWTKFFVPGQTKKKITIVGSSTVFGNLTTNNDSTFVNRLKNYYKAQGIVDTVFNKGTPGSAPWDHNITTDLSDDPDVVILNFPSNQFYGRTTSFIMGEFQKWYDSVVVRRGKQIYITGTQPRPAFSAQEKAQLIVINDSLRLRFGARFIELLKPLSVQPANTETKAEFDALDGVHLNDAGHREVYNIIRAANVFQNTYSSSSAITQSGSANTGISNLVNGIHKFQVSVVDNDGYAASAVSTVTVNIVTANQSPTANAGSNQSIDLPLSQVTLTGSGSDPDGFITAYSWTQISGLPATIVSPSTASTNVTGMTTAGVRVFRLTVTDNNSPAATGFSDVTITVNTTTPSFTKVWVIKGKYTAHYIDANGHVIAMGNRGFTGVGGDGAAAGSVGVPEPPVFTPSTLKFKPQGAGHFHGAALIDTSGRLWTMGATEGGESGMGNLTYTTIPQKLLLDTLGNTFDSIAQVVALAVNDGEGTDQNGYMAMKSTGTIWVWGTVGSMLATGTANTTQAFYRPKRLIIPGGRSAMQIVGGYHCMILCTDSTVWTWGGINAFDEPNLGYDVTSDNQIASLHQVTYPGTRGAKFIEGGGDFNYILTSDNKLYGFGKKGINMGNQAVVIYTPTELTNITSVLPAPISKLTVANDVTAALLTDGTLWTWGDNSQGGIGNGQQYYGFGRDTLHGYSWDYSYNHLNVVTPYHVAPTRTFTDIWSNNLLSFVTVAQGSDGQLYEWGTNKGCTLADQISGPSSGNLGYHDQAWNRNWPTPVNPWTITQQYITDAAPCLFGYSDSTWCESYPERDNLPHIKPQANAGTNQSTTGSNVTLDGSSSSDDIFVSYYLWSQVSGPNTAVIDLPAAKRPIVSNLATGTYVFKLLVIDNEWLYDSAYVQVAVNVVNQLPTAYAGADTSMVLPVTSISLNGTGSTDPDGTIASYQWGQKSGPSALVFSSTSAARPTLSGFIAGTYVIQLYVTDNSGGQSLLPSLRTITATGNQVPVANAGPDQGITMPTSSVNLTGSGTDADGTIVSYAWTQISGPAATRATPAAQNTLVTGLSATGSPVTYIFRLTVTDNGGAIGTDDVIITVNPAGTPPPTASCGGNQTITLPVSSVNLNGTATDAVSYAWTQTSGAAATIASPASLNTNITGMTTAGSYVFLLTVMDGQGRTATCSVTVTVNAAPVVKNIPGRIEAENYDVSNGPQYAIPTTDATGVQDLVGIMQNSYMDYNVTVATTGTYSVTFRVATLQAPQFQILRGVTVLKTVNITSTGGWSTWADVTVTGVSLTAGAQTLRILSTNTASCNFNYMVFTLTTSGNQPPTANAGSNQAVLLPNSTATLTGSGSLGTGGTTLTYQWIQIGGTTATINNPTSTTTTISGLTTPGTRAFQLTVTQDGTLTATSIVFVLVDNPPNLTIPVRGFIIAH
jgi:alpha-tubulin suppressor-like RCC1 family protein